ncbi:3-isopropylmalate dehydrogenase [Candidatus Johnevansia muelleri]|uniref:3-isopropylmalate dehydrogenase n=1 Tax=Candidatus Johnevansia muelleri TaxID=1495769 RepID=A0A078KI55_9GAMM|nr:3-isopropylmalate dehydrogenase [Candidatus Evansia muelleri]
MTNEILILPGDGIGPEIMNEAIKIIDVCKKKGLEVILRYAKIGGDAIDTFGVPLPNETINMAKNARAILLGAVGGAKWDCLDIYNRPEKGLLKLRKSLNLFCNIRPIFLYKQLSEASSLKIEVISGLNIIIVRELIGGIYFGQPRGFNNYSGIRCGYNTCIYDETQIRNIGRVAFEIAINRKKRLCSIDKANVLETSMLWREVMCSLAYEYKDVELSHMYIDNAAMQLVREPKQFDVIVTDNMFGDIISDEAAMLTGSIGMLPSASLNNEGKGIFEPCHGSAPDIAGKNIANPLAMILSLAMMLRYSLFNTKLAERIENAVSNVLDWNLRTYDIAGDFKTRIISTKELGNMILEAF